MDRSIHKEMQLVVDHGGNEDQEVSDLKYRGACYEYPCYKPNRHVGTAFI